MPLGDTDAGLSPGSSRTTSRRQHKYCVALGTCDAFRRVQSITGGADRVDDLDDLTRRANAVGADYVLAKPFVLPQLADRRPLAITRKRWMSDSEARLICPLRTRQALANGAQYCNGAMSMASEPIIDERLLALAVSLHAASEHADAQLRTELEQVFRTYAQRKPDFRAALRWTARQFVITPWKPPFPSPLCLAISRGRKE